jgi:hypothetical protein
MSTEFNWWGRDADGKYQVSAAIHGDTITWQRQQGRFTSWVPYAPTNEDWDRLVAEAETRVPRRLLSPKQFEVIKNLRARAVS